MPLSYKTVLEMQVESEFLKSVRHLFKEVDGFMEFPFHVQYLRISERRLDCICKRYENMRVDGSEASCKKISFEDNNPVHSFLPVVKEQFLSSLYGSLSKYANPVIPINHHHCGDREETDHDVILHSTSS